MPLLRARGTAVQWQGNDFFSFYVLAHMLRARTLYYFIPHAVALLKCNLCLKFLLKMYMYDRTHSPKHHSIMFLQVKHD